MGTNFCSDQVHLPKALKSLVRSLVELGWLFHQVQKYCETPKNESTCGLAARAFAAALQEELSESRSSRFSNGVLQIRLSCR